MINFNEEQVISKVRNPYHFEGESQTVQSELRASADAEGAVIDVRPVYLQVDHPIICLSYSKRQPVMSFVKSNGWFSQDIQ